MTHHSRSPQSVPIPSALEQGLRLIGASPAPMFIVRCDDGGGMIAANPAFAVALQNGSVAQAMNN